MKYRFYSSLKKLYVTNIFLTLQHLNKLLLLWYHENVRVYSDRLINDEDRNWFDQLLRNMMKTEFECDPNEIIGDQIIFFGDFMGVVKEYEEIINHKKASILHNFTGNNLKLYDKINNKAYNIKFVYFCKFRYNI